MGTISDMLNTLGYAEYSGENATLDREAPEKTPQPDHPTGFAANGACAGCELSARYF